MRSTRRPSQPPTWRGWWRHAALALCLLLAQQHASLHWLSHAIQATQSKAGNTGNTGHAGSAGCDECTASTALGGGLASTATQTPVLVNSGPQVAALPVASHAGTGWLAYRSRAPPRRG